MPRQYRRGVEETPDYETDEWSEYLCTGRGQIWLLEPFAHPKNDHKLKDAPELREAWAARQDIMQAWLMEYPGTRPFAWWILEAPEPRPKTGGGGVPCEWGPASKPSYWNDEPRYFIPIVPPNCGEWVIAHGEPMPEFESERDYLERLGLLTAEEKKLLRKQEKKNP